MARRVVAPQAGAVCVTLVARGAHARWPVRSPRVCRASCGSCYGRADWRGTGVCASARGVNPRDACGGADGDAARPFATHHWRLRHLQHRGRCVQDLAWARCKRFMRALMKRVCVCVSVCVCVHTHSRVSNMPQASCVCVCACVRACVRALVCVCIRAHI